MNEQLNDLIHSRGAVVLLAFVSLFVGVAAVEPLPPSLSLSGPRFKKERRNDVNTPVTRPPAPCGCTKQDRQTNREAAGSSKQ